MLAGRGVALLITDGFITTVNSAPLKYVASGYLLWLPVRVRHRGRGHHRHRPVRAAHGARRAHRGGGHQPRGEPAGRRALARHHLRRLRRQRHAGRDRGHHLQLEHHGRRRQRRRRPDRALRDPRGRAGRHLADGRQVHASPGTVIGVLIIQTLKSTILFLGVSSAQSPVFFAVVVILVVLIQSPRVHRMARGLTGGVRSPQAAGPSRRGGRGMSTERGHAVPERRRGPLRPDLPGPARVADADVRRAGHLRRAAGRRADPLRQLRHPAQHVGPAARQRLPADPGRRHDVRHRHRRHRPLRRLGDGVHRDPRAPTCSPTATRPRSSCR